MRSLTASLICAFVLCGPAASRLTADETPPDERRPEIEVVFVLDTTGSMSGLIQAAKDKVWSIADTLATAKPAPVIRFGLVGYRDKGDEYVTRRFQLSDDLDAAYVDLFDYEAAGGGDAPEAVNRALNEAVEQMEWSRDGHVHRVIYLVGDCPPHANEAGEVDYRQTCRLAAEKDIVVNTIQCGSHAATTPVWKEIAKLGGGAFAQIAQSGGLVVRETPFDKKIAELSARRDATRVWFGSETEVRRQVERLDAIKTVSDAAPAAQNAARGAFNASGSGLKNFYFAPKSVNGVAMDSVRELVETIHSGGFDDADEKQVQRLPEEWKSLTPEQRKSKAAAIMKERQELADQIDALSTKRQKHLAAELAKEGEEVPELDRALFESITKQAARKGLTFPKGPKL